MRAALFATAIALAGPACMRSTTFKCADNADCVGAGPQAECDVAAAACTFFDSSCTSMRRYADSSGSRSGECVGGGGMIDGGIDTPMPSGNCRADYMALPNAGPRGHRYLLLDTARTWTQQRDECVAQMGFLAFPDGANVVDAGAELAAMKLLAGDNAWYGINDITTEASYQTSLNQPASAVTRMLITTGGGNPDQLDCFRGANTMLDDDDCAQTHKAVCECIP